MRDTLRRFWKMWEQVPGEPLVVELYRCLAIFMLFVALPLFIVNNFMGY